MLKEFFLLFFCKRNGDWFMRVWTERNFPPPTNLQFSPDYSHSSFKAVSKSSETLNTVYIGWSRWKRILYEDINLTIEKELCSKCAKLMSPPITKATCRLCCEQQQILILVAVCYITITNNTALHPFTLFLPKSTAPKHLVWPFFSSLLEAGLHKNEDEKAWLGSQLVHVL